MGDLKGEHPGTLDDKGRLSLPSKLRSEIEENTLVLTKGLEECLILAPQKVWQPVQAALMEPGKLSPDKVALIRRRLLAPAIDVEIDKAGRIAIPPLLRDHAHLSKDCVVLGIQTHMEIWDAACYKAYCEKTEANFKQVLSEMGPMPLFEGTAG